MTDNLVEALRRKVNAQAGRIDELEDTIQGLETTVDDLLMVVDTEHEYVTYDAMTKQSKVQKLRLALVKTAEKRQGKAAMDYEDVRWLFDGRPSKSYCYDLMEAAGRADGFEYDKQPRSAETNTRITADLDRVKDDALISSVKTSTAKGGS